MHDFASMNDAVTLRGDSISTLGRIDQYDLLRELGGGGFGSVYLAKDTVAGIEVAVKGLPPLIRNNAEELERIRENFALVSRLHHPYIAAALHLQLVRDACYSDDSVQQKLRVLPGDTLVVMEYAPGVTLSKWKKQFPNGKVPFEQAIQIAWQIAQALDYAHELHVIHRDVKPSNIIVETKVDGDIVTRLLDFGLAAEIRSSMGRVSREIRDKSGTRPYMAPEQWAGRKQGPATDQYALAVLLCELLTGEVPFASVFETGDPVVMMTAVCNREVEISANCPCQIALRRALAKDPLLRFANCVEFVEVAADNDKTAQPNNNISQVRNNDKEDVKQKEVGNISANFLRRQRSSLLTWGLVLAVFAVIGVFWFVHYQKQQSKVRRDARIVAERKVEEERREADRKVDEERKTNERRKAVEKAKKKAEAERNNKAEMTLQFISAYETKQYDVAAKLMASINSSNAEVQFDIAKMYQNGWGVPKNEAESVRWYLKAAEQGYGKAQNNLGAAFREGAGIAKDYAAAMRWFRKAAEQGEAISQTNIGQMYRDGKGVKKDYPEAMRWFRKAAEQGDSLAQLCIAGMYFAGWGVAKDESEAVKWLYKSANQDVASAQRFLGMCYANGYGVAKNLQEAEKWYRKAAEQGNAEARKALDDLTTKKHVDSNGGTTDATQRFLDAYKADRYSVAASLINSIDCDNAEVQFNLGWMYENGQGVGRNYAEALRWYRKAANQNMPVAQFNIGVMYADGRGVAKNMTEAVRWYRLAAEQGYAAAQNNLGLACRLGSGIERNDYEGVRWYRKAAEQEYPMAMNNLGLAYANGNGVDKDEKEAVKWYRKAAEKGYAAAEYHLGLAYANGNGVAKDGVEAVRWYRKAADQGFADAQCNLGVCYAYGRGVPQDYIEAMRWYRKAALQGDSQSQFNLGVMYHFGFGVSKDKDEAIRWYSKASEQGHSEATKNLRVISSE